MEDKTRNTKTSTLTVTLLNKIERIRRIVTPITVVPKEAWVPFGFNYWRSSLPSSKSLLSVADPGEGPGLSRLFLDPNEARGAEKHFFDAAPPPSSRAVYLRVCMTGPPLSEGHDPPLIVTLITSYTNPATLKIEKHIFLFKLLSILNAHSWHSDLPLLLWGAHPQRPQGCEVHWLWMSWNTQCYFSVGLPRTVCAFVSLTLDNILQQYVPRNTVAKFNPNLRWPRRLKQKTKKKQQTKKKENANTKIENANEKKQNANN